jgi:hypothetical protein
MDFPLQGVGLGHQGLVGNWKFCTQGLQRQGFFIKKTTSAYIKSWQQYKKRGILMTAALSTQITVV